MTNRHVLRENLKNEIIPNTETNRLNPCRSGELQFNFTELNQKVGCKAVLFAFSEEYGADAVFIELDKVPTGASFLALEKNPSTDRSIKIAGHPFGSDKLSMTSCEIKNGYQHNCDTLFGSSGSPLIDSDCKVQGLHYGAHKNQNGILCSQLRTDDTQKRCSHFSHVPKECMNNYLQSNHLSEVTNLLLRKILYVKDPLQDFDSLNRYALWPDKFIPSNADTTTAVTTSDGTQ